MGIIVSTTCNRWTACSGTAIISPTFSTATIETLSPDASEGNPTTLTGLAGWKTIARGEVEAENYLMCIPMANANNATAGLRVWGWNKSSVPSGGLNGGQIVYVPTLLFQCSYTAGNLASQRLSGMFATDTITQTFGPASGTRVESPTAETTPLADTAPGYFIIDLLGSQFVLFDFAINSGSATSMNGLFRTMS